MGLPNIGPLELIIILAIALLIVGPGRLPGMGKAIGDTIKEFRRASSDITDGVSGKTDEAAAAQSAPNTSTQPPSQAKAEPAEAAASGEPSATAPEPTETAAEPAGAAVSDEPAAGETAHEAEKA